MEAPPLQLALRQREWHTYSRYVAPHDADSFRFPSAQATTQPGGKCVYRQEPYAGTLLGVFEGLTLGSSAGRPSGTSSRKESRVNSPQPFFKTPLLLSHPCFLAVLRFGVPDRSTRIGTGGVLFGCERRRKARRVCGSFRREKRRRIFPFGPYPPGFAISIPGIPSSFPSARERERESLRNLGLTWSDASTSFARPDSLAHRLYERVSQAYRQTD